MRGRTDLQTSMVVVDLEELIPEQHPIRRVRPFVEAALSRLEPTFEEMYAKVGRPSIPPEHLLKASVLMALYSIRSERQFCERLQYDLLFKWFLGLDIEDAAFDATSFSKNRERLMDNLVSKLFFQAVALEPAFHGGWDAPGVMGFAEEPSAQAEPGRPTQTKARTSGWRSEGTAGWEPQSGSELARRKALERDTSVKDGS